MKIIPKPTDFLTPDHTQRPSSGQKFTLLYITDGKVLCAAELRLTADTRFVDIPIPVIHEIKRGLAR